MDLIELFREYFRYENGELFWIKTAGSRAIKDSKAGKIRKDGYYDVGLKGKYFLVHRVIFALHHDYLPEFVDHIDHNPSNNKIENLRAATPSSNGWNSRKSASNTSGVKGVRITKNKKFEARVACHGQTYQVGTFDTIEAAKTALESFRQKIHKDFTCNG